MHELILVEEADYPKISLMRKQYIIKFQIINFKF